MAACPGIRRRHGGTALSHTVSLEFPGIRGLSGFHLLRSSLLSSRLLGFLITARYTAARRERADPFILSLMCASLSLPLGSLSFSLLLFLSFRFIISYFCRARRRRAAYYKYISNVHSFYVRALQLRPRLVRVFICVCSLSFIYAACVSLSP